MQQTAQNVIQSASEDSPLIRDARPQGQVEPINLMPNADDDEHPLLMPAEQIVQQQLDAYNRRDIDAWLATYAADAEQYLLHGGLIRKATFSIGQAVDVDQGAKRMRSIDEQISLRPAMATDTLATRVIHHSAVRDVVMRQFGAWDEAVQDRFFDNGWNPERFEIVECGGKPCGYFRREHHQTFIEIHEINIDPAYQGQGIGTRILMDTLANADQLGLPVVLQTLHLNRAAGLYQRLGFGEIGRTATHIQMQRDCPPSRL